MTFFRIIEIFDSFVIVNLEDLHHGIERFIIFDCFLDFFKRTVKLFKSRPDLVLGIGVVIRI